jgi:hypothetical protein
MLTSFELERDGIVYTASNGECPVKLRTPYAAWNFVLCRRLGSGLVNGVQLPLALRRADVEASAAYPG